MREKALEQKLNVMLNDWEKMQRTDGDEGADWAERFEMHFYEFINEVKAVWSSLEAPPQTLEEAEELPFIQAVEAALPAPLQLNFLNELELIVEGTEEVRYD